MRLLLLAPFAPRTDARHGGARAIAAAVLALGARHELGLVHLADPDGVDAPVRDAAAFVEALPAPDVLAAPRRSRLRVYAALASGLPVAVAERVTPAVVARLRGVVETWRPELVQAEFLATAALLPALAGHEAPCVLVDHDASLRPLEAFDRLPSPLARGLRAVDARAWRSFEGRVAGSVDVAVVFTERDRAACEAAGFGDVRVVPLVVPWRGRPLDPVGTSPPTLLFVGYYRHPPNADAARWLVDEIFPRVRAACPDARLVLAGGELPPDIAARAGDGVELPGAVTDLEALLERAAVVVAPLRTGGGARVKVLEALGAGKAVVATPRAVEGIDAGAVLRVASSAQELAREIAALLGDPEQRGRLGTAAYAWAAAELDGRRTADRYGEIYADVRSRG